MTPVVTLRPGARARWEAEGGIEDIAAVARAADRLGYELLTCSEHVAIPRDVVAARGGRYWDPLATFGYLAAVTERIRFLTYVLVLGYHHPLAIAKRYGTLDRISGGRLILGVGVGTLREEFDLLGIPFEGRGARADDAIRALRASFGREEPAYSGMHYRYDGFVIDPSAVQERVPIWIGGQSARSLRRAVELGDGWCPFNLTAEQAGSLLARARGTEAWGRRERPLEVCLMPERPLDPRGDPAGARTALDRFRDMGTTVFNVRLVHHSLAHFCEQLEAAAKLGT